MDNETNSQTIIVRVTPQLKKDFSELAKRLGLYPSTLLRNQMIKLVEEEKKGIEISSSRIATDVKTLIKDALPSGIPSIAHIGKHIGIVLPLGNLQVFEGNIGFG